MDRKHLLARQARRRTRLRLLLLLSLAILWWWPPSWFSSPQESRPYLRTQRVNPAGEG